MVSESVNPLDMPEEWKVNEVKQFDLETNLSDHDKWDWVERGTVNSPLDQGHCNSAFAFAANAPIEHAFH